MTCVSNKNEWICLSENNLRHFHILLHDGTLTDKVDLLRIRFHLKHIYIYVSVCVCVYIYIYIYRERERERKIESMCVCAWA